MKLIQQLNHPQQHSHLTEIKVEKKNIIYIFIWYGLCFVYTYKYVLFVPTYTNSRVLILREFLLRIGKRSTTKISFFYFKNIWQLNEEKCVTTIIIIIIIVFCVLSCAGEGNERFFIFVCFHC